MACRSLNYTDLKRVCVPILFWVCAKDSLRAKHGRTWNLSWGAGLKTSDIGMFRLDFQTLQALKLARWADQMADNSLASA
jgi:hypothetical protein